MPDDVRLWVIRHGETDWNHERRVQGHSDAALNANGRVQVEELADELKLELSDLAPLLVSSDLVRARDTARIVARALGVATVVMRRDLRERSLGEVEGLTWAEVGVRHAAAVEAYKSGADRDALPGCEPYAAFRARVLRGVAEVARAAPRAVIVTHGGALRVLLTEALGEDKQFIVSNAAVFRFRWRPERLERVLRF